MHIRKTLGDLVHRRLGLAADADHEIVLGGEIGQRLIHVGVIDVLDHLDLDLVAILLLGRHQAVIGRFHPALVGLRAGNQDADLERVGGVSARRKSGERSKCAREQSAPQDQTT